MKSRDEMLAAAVDYVYRQGLCVIPMSRETKRPLIKWKEYQDRLPTFSEIAGWPDCNLAMVTGRISGIVVIDCESRADAEWFYKERSQTPTVSQTKRGFHLYFAHTGALVRNAIKVVGKYDVRGDGGYVLIPPSSHSEGEYCWKQPLNKAALPPFRQEWRPDSVDTRVEREITDGAAYIANIRAISGQAGHNATYRAVCCLFSAGLSEGEALLTMLEWNKINAEPPWSERELLHKVRDVYSN